MNGLRRSVIAVLLGLMLILSLPAAGQHDAPPVGDAGEPVAEHAEPDRTPVLPESPVVWPGVLLIGILAMFLAAAVIGWLVRIDTSDDLPPPIPTTNRPAPPGTTVRAGPIHPNEAGAT